MCYRCFWPKTLCWCPSIQPMPTRTRFVFLMSPMEFKREKAGTGRLTHLCLPHSEIHMGKSFDEHAEVQALLNDPRNFCVLLYPGVGARNVSTGGLTAAEIGDRQLVVILLDATWNGARKILGHSACLKRLPRVMFNASGPSRYVIKQQPQVGCLSTLEATHEMLRALEQAKLDEYRLPEQLLELFQRMQDFQIKCAADLTRPGYRRRPYSAPGERQWAHGRSGTRRRYVPKIEPAP